LEKKLNSERKGWTVGRKAAKGGFVESIEKKKKKSKSHANLDQCGKIKRRGERGGGHLKGRGKKGKRKAQWH